MYRGIYTAPPNSPEGLQMVYIPDKQAIRVDGWHGNGRLQSTDIPLADFLRGLGVTLADCQQALGAGTNVVGQPAAQPTVTQPVARAASEAPPRTTGVPSEAPPKLT